MGHVQKEQRDIPSSLVIRMGIEVLLMIICALSTWFALRFPGRLS